MANNHIENHSKTPLHSACKNQNLELVRSLLKDGEDPNAVDDQMYTPLHLVCTSKSDVTATIIELLLQHNADIEAVLDRYRWTPLITACIHNNDVAVKCLLENHANPSAVDCNGYTPLHLVCSAKEDTTVTLIELLIQHHVNIEAVNTINGTPLTVACMSNNHNAVKCLVDHHANTEAVDVSGTTPLMFACRNSNYDTIKYLLDHHANVETADESGITPLMEACKNCNYDTIKCLLDHHANIEAVNQFGRTPLMFACKSCNFNAIKCLLDYHANIEAVDQVGSTPLIIACANCNYDTIKWLLDHHANIEAVNQLVMTPLLTACTNDNHDAIKCLLDHHANTETVDVRGCTPLMIACRNDNHNAIKYLLDHQANIEAVDSTVWTQFMVDCNNGNHNTFQQLLDFEEYRKFKIFHYYAYDCSRTPLHFACKNQNLELVRSLLKNGENPNAVDDQMNTPLHLACTSKSDVTVTIIEVLLQHNANIEAAENECGWTPLFTACLHNNDVAVKYLLENHADPNALDRMGYTPLHWIFFCYSDDVALSTAKLLLQYNANIEARSNNGRTPFLMACYNCNYVTAKFFLDNHANLLAVDDNGYTSLHFVCDRKNDMTVMLIELLVQHHANIEAVDKRGWTPFMVASNRGNCEAIKCLFDHYANVNHFDINNSTALHIAIKQQSLKTTECLIKCNADINLLDKENQTPLEKALNRKPREAFYYKIIDILEFEVVKLKVAGFEVHDHNLDTLYTNGVRRLSVVGESCFKNEIERMKKKNICHNEITLYDLLKNDIRFLCKFVTDNEIQQELKQKYLDKQFKSYINIVRNRFREAIIQCTRNELINQAKEYFKLYINQQLPDEILDCIFISLSISELRCFVKSYQKAIK